MTMMYDDGEWPWWCGGEMGKAFTKIECFLYLIIFQLAGQYLFLIWVSIWKDFREL